MDGRAIAAAAIGDAGRRMLPSESVGPEPVRATSKLRPEPETAGVAASDPARTVRTQA